MPTKLRLQPAFLSQIPDFPNWIDAIVLNAGTAESYSIPEDARALFVVPVKDDGTAGTVIGSVTGTAAEETADTTDGTASGFPIVGPYIFAVPSGGTLSLIRAGADQVTVYIGVYKA